jgi:mRNA-degrading endonuclease RelE of RelBE toxin-antitoxin system
MTPVYSVQVTATFEGEFRKLLKGHSILVAALAQDPYNRTRAHLIKRLTAVNPGDGQFRIRYLRYRFVYDIDDETVFLKHSACVARTPTSNAEAMGSTATIG